MTRFPTMVLCSMAALLLVGGCAAADDDKAPSVAPDLGSLKADSVSDVLNDRGPLAFGDEATGEFVDEGQLEAYTFTAAAGARITLENTHRGTARALDSTLFLYGPLDAAGQPGNTPIAEDDDGGWGRHAKIGDFVIPTRGTYVAVLGTYAGLDTGRYRLTLTCAEGCEQTELVTVSKAHVLTGEAGDTDTFTVRLTEAPTDHVFIWVESGDTGEGVPFPAKLVFCAPGFVPDDKDCAPIEGPEQADALAQWAEPIEVTVHGVRDALDDGDVDYALRLHVVSDAVELSGLALPDIAGTNVDDATRLDYGALEPLEDDALLAALYERIGGHTAYGYLGQNSIRTVMFSSVDVQEGLVEGIYTGKTVASPRESPAAFQLGFNTEHTWPQGQFDGLEPMKSDLHHIFPADVAENGLRSSYDFGMTADATSQRSMLGTSAEGTETIYQVRPSRRGDVARAHFYMVARYRLATSEIGVAFDDDGRADNGSIHDTEEAVLRRWHAEDPVDQAERDRNDRVEAYQGNRNPFVDRPDLVERIRDF